MKLHRVDLPAFDNASDNVPHVVLVERTLDRSFEKEVKSVKAFFEDAANLGTFSGQLLKTVGAGITSGVDSAGQADLTNILNSSNVAGLNSTESYLDQIKNLYPGKDTAVYKIPILNDFGYSVDSEWTDANLITALTSGFLDSGPIAALANKLPINREMGLSWVASKSSIEGMEFYLINDTKSNTERNLRFIHSLNMAVRFSQSGTLRFSPNVFSLTVYGFYHCPFVAVNKLAVKTVGQFSKRKISRSAISVSDKALNPTTSDDVKTVGTTMGSTAEGSGKISAGNDGTEMLLPQAFKVSVSFIELVRQSQEAYLMTMNGAMRISPGGAGDLKVKEGGKT
jgi:hypothetical protein